MSHIEQISPYLTWRIRHKVLYPDLDFDKSILPDDDDGTHLGLFDNNTLISVTSLFKRDRSMQFRKFATLQEYQGKGYGSELLEYVTDYAKSLGCNHLWCNARENASGFYLKFGFSETDKKFTTNGHDIVIMEKTI